MLGKPLARAALCIVGVLALTAFSKPIAEGGRDFARSLRAPAQEGCDKCEDNGSTHAFTGVGAYFSCTACNSCHTNWQTGWCGNYHCDCIELEDALTAGDPITAEKVAAVAAQADSKAVSAFLARHPNRVEYNARRRMLQLLACDSKIVAQFPVADGVGALDQVSKT